MFTEVKWGRVPSRIDHASTVFLTRSAGGGHSVLNDTRPLSRYSTGDLMIASKIRLGSHTLPPNGALSGDYRLSTEDATDRRMNRVLRSEKDVKKIGRCCDAELKRSKRLYKRLGDLRKTMKRESSRLHYQLTPLQPRLTGTTSSLAEFRNGDLEQYYYRSPVYEIMGRQASILNMYPYSDSLRRRYRL
ncbi:hypothetical protein FOL46_008505 [Perkinsus olseni]|uniref:Uncharacterized protein n=1 Tax=Perkinsus olseni TaxID=32597 RepID=A0A7J6MMC4_PEROL|nr:hypothetical protein FOL46_008505 [Perkinsus olseni]